MYLLDKLAEEKINTAMQRGEFNNLPGAGMRLPEEDLTFVPEDMRMAYRILKNSGYIPPELELHHQICSLESMLQQENSDSATRRQYLKKLHCLYLKLEESRQRQLNLALQNEYYEKIICRLSGT